MNFLDQARESAQARLRTLPTAIPKASSNPTRFSEALAGRDTLAIIAEIKKRSPSAGDIAPRINPIEQCDLYQAAQVNAISVLTEPLYFGGSLADLERVAQHASLPVMMKDFVISPEQVRVSALLGASAFLVILRLVDDALLNELLAAGREYGVEPLLEVRTPDELQRALAVDGVIGMNNRDLDTLLVDPSFAAKLVAQAPANRVVVAESGYKSAEDLQALRHKFDGVLIGSALMRAKNPVAFLKEAISCA